MLIGQYLTVLLEYINWWVCIIKINFNGPAKCGGALATPAPPLTICVCTMGITRVMSYLYLCM